MGNNISEEANYMTKPIYFSKIEYCKSIGRDNVSSIMLLNLTEKTLSYQVLDKKEQMPAIQGVISEVWDDKVYSYTISKPARVIRNGKTEFKPQLLPIEQYDETVKFSYAVNLTDEQMKNILPYCNALKFDPYRNKEMSMNDDGYIGYRDEVRMSFTAITDSYIPKIELPMSYYYDEKHIWPSERLYRYLVKTYFENNKKVKGWGPEYGELSL